MKRLIKRIFSFIFNRKRSLPEPIGRVVCIESTPESLEFKIQFIENGWRLYQLYMRGWFNQGKER